MNHTHHKLQGGPEPIYDLIRRPLNELDLNPGSYTELFTGFLTLMSCSFD